MGGERGPGRQMLGSAQLLPSWILSTPEVVANTATWSLFYHKEWNGVNTVYTDFIWYKLWSPCLAGNNYIGKLQEFDIYKNLLNIILENPENGKSTKLKIWTRVLGTNGHSFSLFFHKTRDLDKSYQRFLLALIFCFITLVGNCAVSYIHIWKKSGGILLLEYLRSTLSCRNTGSLRVGTIPYLLLVSLASSVVCLAYSRHSILTKLCSISLRYLFFLISALVLTSDFLF